MTTFAEIQASLRELPPQPSAYLAAARQLEASVAAGGRMVRVAVVATFTSELLKPYVTVECARHGLRAVTHFAPFNQLEQQLADATSPLYAFAPDVIVVAARLEDFAGDLISRFVKLSASEIENEAHAVVNRLGQLVESARRHSAAKIFLWNLAQPTLLCAGLADGRLEVTQAEVVHQINRDLAAVCRRTPDAFVFDYARLVGEFGVSRWHDAKLNYLGRSPFTVGAQIALSEHLAQWLRAAILPSAKCLVLDLDDTLWGGVLGEEGLGGIALGEEFPGRVFKDFQRYLLALRDRGVLLAVASKNNEAEVREVFEKHPDCLLRWDDFAARQINWEPKPLALEKIARELNLGLDALVFFDDNPAERELVRQQSPDVTVLETPKSSLDYIATIERSGVFNRLTLSAEDVRRGEIYGAQRERAGFATASGSLEDFLRGLKMQATLGTVDAATLERVVQLLGKTNQFNLTTRRHDAAKVSELMRTGAVALWLRVADRFGDNGLVGVAVAVPETGACWVLDSFLLSCRVIGRQVETVLLHELARRVAARGGRELRGEFLPTAKNAVAKDFFPRHGFAARGENSWTLVLAPDALALPEFISVTRADAVSL